MSKIIFDPIHKYMEFEPLLLSIIDTPEFQRLRNIKQLGACYYVFPGAKHNRFEHSLGVSHLCGLLITKLQKSQPELKITDREVILIKIAGLVHDIGHACFSHFFDHKFLEDKESIDSNKKQHEYRSGLMIKYIINKYNLDISDEEIILMQSLINPNETQTNFLYQIVSNKKNGLDCDRLDYISRDTYNIGLSYSFDSSRLIKYAKVIDNKICYPVKCYSDIFDLYYTRYKLFKQIYTHPAVRSIEYMILDLLNMSNNLKIVEKVNDISKFYKLTDNILDIISYYGDEKQLNLLNDINSRNLYKMIIEIDKNEVNNFKDFIKNKGLENEIIIDEIVLNFSMNNKNPMDHVNFYKDSKIINTKINELLPYKFEEIFYRVYVKNINLKNHVLCFFK